MRINFNSNNYLHNTSFKSKFTENSKKDLYKAAGNDPVSVYATIQMAKNDKENDVLLLRRSDTLRDGHDLLFFKFDKKEKEYDCYDRNTSSMSPLLYSLYCPDQQDWAYDESGGESCISDKKREKLDKKYTKELIQAANCTKLTEQINETRKQLEKTRDKLNNLERERNKNLTDYVKKVIDEEATVNGEIFDSYQWSEGNEPRDYGM